MTIPAPAAEETAKQPFPRTFYYANGMELLERLAHYGFYIGLSLYLTTWTKKIDQVWTMALGVLIGATSMLVMGAIPTIVGAVLSGAIFALAEMTFSPRFFDYIASFAPKGKAGMYMGMAFVPAAIGAWSGGQASGFLIATYLPKEGLRQPLVIWSIYAGLGLTCALAMGVYGVATRAARARADVA